NYVGINERPDEVFGKLMSVSDAMLWRYFELLTRVPEAEMSGLRAGHPMEAKKRLAGVITAQYHGDRAAGEAAEHFARVHQHRADPEEIETTRVAGGLSPVGGVLKEGGVAASTSEAG